MMRWAVFALCAAGWAADASLEGYAAYRSGDFASARRSFETAASRGDARAMNFLGTMYAEGRGVAKDRSQALVWFRSSAEKGDPEGENNLGEMYASGWGVAADPRAAAEWFRRAAEGGSAPGAYNLGRLLLAGVGAPKDPPRAAQYLEKAVRSSPGEARYRNWLGSAYCDQGRFSDADEQFRAVVANGGKPEQAWNYDWGRALVGLERWDDAAQAFRRCRGEDPAHNRGVDRRAEAAAQLQKIESYREHYRKAMQALSFHKLGEARRELEAALVALESREARERLAAVEAGIGGTRLGLLAGGLVALLAVSLAVWTAMRLRRPRPLAALTTQADITGLKLDGRYELKGLIGEGGMGQVYLAFDHERGSKVAAKRMRPELRQWPKPRARFLNEAKAISRLKHPNIVGIQAVLDQGGEAVLILDFVEGDPLSSLIQKKGRIGFAAARDIMLQVCAAVACAHAAGVVHRDLKPSNIMVEPGGAARVTDFGLARDIKDTLSHLTRTEIAGTLVYMAPEQHLGNVCRQSDVYALGVTLYEMATGVPPFSGPDFLVQKQWRRYRKAAELAPGLPEGVDSLLSDALEPKPEKRLRTAAEFSVRLTRIEIS